MKFSITEEAYLIRFRKRRIKANDFKFVPDIAKEADNIESVSMSAHTRLGREKLPKDFTTMFET